MDREKFLEKLFPLIGGKENTSLCEFQDGVLYVTLKDAGLSDENAVAKLPDVASATLRRGRLTVTFGEPERKEEVPFMANKIRTTARWRKRSCQCGRQGECDELFSLYDPASLQPERY